ncbi:MAG TPA: hypothetical protein VF660_07930 [Actinomycetota bacterium]|jgi:vacuolar-type H+-ATPase subunit H
MDIETRLQQLRELIEQARSMPLSSSVMVNREEILELIETAASNLPEEIRQARWVVKDREDLLAKARRDGEIIVAKARQERDRLVSREEVVRAAQSEAERLVGEGREQSRQLSLEAEDYVESKLAELEQVLTGATQDLEGALAQVRRGREMLSAGGNRAADQAPRPPKPVDIDLTAMEQPVEAEQQA